MRLVQVIVFVVMACLVFNADPAQSDGPKVLLNLSKFRNWLQLDYRWYRNNSVNKKGTDLELKDHLFIEKFHSAFKYSIYDPLILNGRFSTDLGLNQEIYQGHEDSGTESGTILEYDIDGTFFERRFYPTHFFSSEKRRDIQRIFARNYDLYERDHGLALALKNAFLPTNFRYSRRRRETDGLELDRVETTETFTFDALHLYKDLSHTEVSFYHSDDDIDFDSSQPADKSRISEYLFRNSLHWGTLPTRSRLDSTYRLRDEDNTISYKFKDWSESLFLQPGRALRIGLNYDYTSDSTKDQSRHEHREQVWIEHKLYESFTSRLRVLNRKTDYTAGMYKNVQGIGGLSYQKKLPRSSLLSLGYSYTNGRTKRDQDLRQAWVLDEQVTMKVVGPNFLENLDIIVESITVKNKDRTITYVEGPDYIVLQYGRQTELILTAGSPINPRDVVSVDYLCLMEPKLHYSTTVHQASSSLSLFSNRYRIYAYLVDNHQKPLSDDTDEEYMNDLFTYTIGLVNTRRFATYGGEFVHYDATYDKRQYLEFFWRYRRYYRRNYLWLSVRDRVIRHEQVQESKFDDEGDTENQLYAGVSVRRRLFGRNIAKAGLEYLDVRGGYTYDRQELNLNFNFNMHIGRLELQLRADRGWEWWKNRRRGETRVFLMVRRYLAF